MQDQDGGSDPGAVIPSINTASSTAAIRSLGRMGVKPVAISEDDDAPGFRSRYCRERIGVPDPLEDVSAYEEALLSLARRRDIRTILPFREVDVYVLSRNRRWLESHVGTPWPSLDALNRVQDRLELVEAATTAGVSSPETDVVSNWTDWESPAIVKPRYTMLAPEYQTGVEQASVVTESTRYIEPGDEPAVDELVATMGHEPIVQEYVPSTEEYGFFALYDEGSAVATFQHRQRRGWKYAGGPSAYRESVDIPELERLGLALLDELDWHGVAMVEFLRDPATGRFELMEINPRFWSSLPFTIQAGVDFPALFWQQAIGRTLPDGSTYSTDIGGHLLWGEFLHVHSILTEDYPLVERPSLSGTLQSIGRSVVSEPRFDYLDRDDPGPFVRDLRNSLGEVTGCRG